MIETWDNLDETRARVWSLLERGLTDPQSPARQLVLATVGRQGGAEARIVILRSAVPATGILEIHTDGGSEKIEEITATPGGTLLVWDPADNFQIRLRVDLSVRTGTTTEWAKVPDGSRRGYGGTPPGWALAQPSDFVVDPDPNRFAVVMAKIAEIETLRLARDYHRRAIFTRKDGFQGQWVAP